MKKINLQTLKEGLTRDEMRALKGGGCGSAVGAYCQLGSIVFNCAPGLRCVPYQWWPGSTSNSSGICSR